MRLAISLSAAAFGLVLALLFFGVVAGFAAEPCAGHWARASWYGAESGKRTASGAAFDGRQWLVASPSLPLGTLLRLTYRGRSVTVPVADRGPYVAGRELDLSRAVAEALGTIPVGVALICAERIN